MSLPALADTVVRVTDSNPPWLTYSLSHLRASLCILSHDELHAASSRVCPHFSVSKHYDKMSCIDAVLHHFDSCPNLFLSCSLISLRMFARPKFDSKPMYSGWQKYCTPLVWLVTSHRHNIFSVGKKQSCSLGCNPEGPIITEI